MGNTWGSWLPMEEDRFQGAAPPEHPCDISRSALFSFFAEVGVFYEKTSSEFPTLSDTFFEKKAIF